MFTLFTFIIFITSCSNDESFIEQTDYVNVMGDNVELKNNTLSFKNQEELQNLLNKIKNQGKVLTRQVTKDVYIYIQDKSWNIDGFESLYDIYQDAMKNAEYYYDRDGGYEEFKQKYSALYFPEYNDDYSAYLPISDPALSKIVNSNGDVYIDDKIVNMKDINTYKQLVDLELTFPAETTEKALKTRATDLNGYYIISVNEMIYSDTGKRRNQISLDNTTYEPLNNLQDRKHISGKHHFRKKGFLGAWYNYSSEACVGTDQRLKHAPAPVKGDPSLSYDTGSSPLDYHVAYVVRKDNRNITSDFSAWHRGIGYWSIISL